MNRPAHPKPRAKKPSRKIAELTKRLKMQQKDLEKQAAFAGGCASVDDLINLYELVGELAHELLKKV